VVSEFFSLPPGIGMIMTESIGAVRRRQYCALCGQQMFEFYRSPDGHFGFVDEVMAETSARGLHVRCATCGARYRLLERVDAAGQPVARI
jgi:hypothetical protein